MSDQPHWLARTIEVYSAEGEDLIDEYPLPAVDLASLQDHWRRPVDDPMLDAFEVTEDQRPSHPDLQGLRRFVLVTKDAQRLYEPFSFKTPELSGHYMEIFRPDIYKRR